MHQKNSSCDNDAIGIWKGRIPKIFPATFIPGGIPGGQYELRQPHVRSLANIVDLGRLSSSGDTHNVRHRTDGLACRGQHSMDKNFR